MPPFDLWLTGRDDIFAWWFGPGIECAGLARHPDAVGQRLAGVRAVQAEPDGRAATSPWALQVLEISGGRIAEMTFFLDTATLFPLFGLPARLEA